MQKPPKFQPLSHLPLHSPKPHQEEQQILPEEPGPNKRFSQLTEKRTKRVSLTVPMALKTNQKAVLKKKNPSFCKENCLTEYKILIHPENTSSLQEL